MVPTTVRQLPLCVSVCAQQHCVFISLRLQNPTITFLFHCCVSTPVHRGASGLCLRDIGGPCPPCCRETKTVVSAATKAASLSLSCTLTLLTSSSCFLTPPSLCLLNGARTPHPLVLDLWHTSQRGLIFFAKEPLHMEKVQFELSGLSHGFVNVQEITVQPLS